MPHDYRRELSVSARAVLDQLSRQRAVEDGDIISKEGREELIKSGLALRRTPIGRKLAVTTLTLQGQQLAGGGLSRRSA